MTSPCPECGSKSHAAMSKCSASRNSNVSVDSRLLYCQPEYPPGVPVIESLARGQSMRLPGSEASSTRSAVGTCKLPTCRAARASQSPLAGRLRSSPACSFSTRHFRSDRGEGRGCGPVGQERRRARREHGLHGHRLQDVFRASDRVTSCRSARTWPMRHGGESHHRLMVVAVRPALSA